MHFYAPFNILFTLIILFHAHNLETLTDTYEKKALVAIWHQQVWRNDVLWSNPQSALLDSRVWSESQTVTVESRIKLTRPFIMGRLWLNILNHCTQQWYSIRSQHRPSQSHSCPTASGSSGWPKLIFMAFPAWASTQIPLSFTSWQNVCLDCSPCGSPNFYLCASAYVWLHLTIIWGNLFSNSAVSSWARTVLLYPVPGSSSNAPFLKSLSSTECSNDCWVCHMTTLNYTLYGFLHKQAKRKTTNMSPFKIRGVTLCTYTQGATQMLHAYEPKLKETCKQGSASQKLRLKGGLCHVTSRRTGKQQSWGVSCYMTQATVKWSFYSFSFSHQLFAISPLSFFIFLHSFLLQKQVNMTDHDKHILMCFGHRTIAWLCFKYAW